MLEQYRVLSDAGREQLSIAGARGGRERWTPAPFWTPERLEKLKQLTDEKQLSAGQIGKELGCTRNAIIGKCHRLGLTLRTPAAPRPRKEKKVRAPRSGDAGGLSRPRRSGGLTLPTTTEPIEPLKVPLIDLNQFHCRSPVGEAADNLYCGHPTDGESSWCPAHRRLYTYRVAR